MRKLILILAISFSIAACSSKQEAPKPVVEAPKPPSIPTWVLNPIIEGGLAATDCVPATNDFSLDKTQATAQGRAALAKQIDVKVQAMDKTYQNKTTTAGGSVSGNTFESVSKQVSEQNLKGSRVTKVEYVNMRGTENLCAMVTLDPAATDKFFNQIIDGSQREVSPQDKEVLYQEFKAYQAQQELASEFAN